MPVGEKGFYCLFLLGLTGLGCVLGRVYFCVVECLLVVCSVSASVTENYMSVGWASGVRVCGALCVVCRVQARREKASKPSSCLGTRVGLGAQDNDWL